MWLLLICHAVSLIHEPHYDRDMWPEIAAAALEGGGEAGAGGAGAGGTMKDFNDMPVGSMPGSIGGKILRTITGPIGTGETFLKLNIAPVGSMTRPREKAPRRGASAWL